MQKRQSRCRTFFILLLAFLLPVAVLLAIYASFGFAPFGEKSLLIMDMSDQYVEFYANLRHMGQNGDIFFSWGKAMGGNYTGVFAYYLSSPFSFLVLLFPQEQITTALFVMNLLKIACAGLSFTLFLRNRFDQWNPMFIVFSIAYALMSYNVVYSMCLMWLDGVIWLPLVLAGSDRVLQGKRTWLLIVSLAMLFVSNYYTSYMVVLFAVIYFLLRYFAEKGAPARLFPKKLGVCAASVVGAAGLGAWLLLPTLCALQQGKIGSSGNAQVQTFNFDLSQLPAKFLPGVYDSITNSGLPSVFCGCLVLFLVICFFFHPVFSKRERLASGAVLAVLIVCFWIGPLDVVWHVFQAPNWFPYRYAFVFGFFMVYLSARAFLSFRQLPVRRFLAAAGMWAVFCLAAYLLWKDRSWESILAALLTGVVSIVLLAIVRRNKGKQAAAILLTAALALCSVGELWYNGSELVEGLDKQFRYKTEASYTGFLEEVQPLVDAANEKADGKFFRMEKDFERSKNDALGLGYNGVTHYSSAYSRTINSFLENLGMAQAYFWDSYYGATPITDALFSVRYLMMKGEVCEWYSALQTSGEITLYENPDALSLAFAACGDLNTELNNDPFANQEALLKAVLPYDGSCWSDVADLTAETKNAVQSSDGVYTVFEKDGGSPSVIYRFRTVEAGPIYAYFESPSANSCEVFVNGESKGDYFTNETRMNLYLGTFDAGEVVEVRFAMRNSSLTIGNVFIRTLNETLLREQLQQIKSNQMEIESYSARYVSGTVTAEEDGFLFTSIPYDAGWSVKIDGVQTETSALCETLLVVPLTEGTHQIEFSYSPVGLLPGIIITLLTVLIFALILIVYLYKRQKKSKKQKGR